MHEFFADLDRLLPLESRVATATVVATHGATPRRQGARMLVGEGGRILGSVTIGGCVDARVIEEAERSLADGAPRLVELSLGDEDAWETGLSCGGTVDVLVQPLQLDKPSEWPLSALTRLREHLAAGRRAALVTRLDAERAGIGLLMLDTGEVVGSLGHRDLDRAATTAANELLASGRSQDLSIDGARIFVEVFGPPSELIIVGASHLAMALTDMARLVGYTSIVLDGRPRFATPERFPHADLRVGIPSELLAAMSLTPATALVLAAHDYKYDLPVLRHALRTPVGYIGMLGSRRRGDTIRGFLRDEGFSDDDLVRIRVPIGLDLGGPTVAEIALAIVSEIVAEARRGSARPLRNLTGVGAKSSNG